MSKKWLKYFFAFVAALCMQNLRAQDAAFSQAYMAPLYLNPAYSGMPDYTRVGATYQYQWRQLGSPYMLYSVYADYYFDAANSGVGLYAASDRQADGTLTQTSVGASYAYNLRLAEKTFVRFGLQALLDITSTNASKLIFPDMIDGSGSVSSGGEPYASEQKPYFDMAVGGVFSHQMFYLGVALHNLMRMPDGDVLGQRIVTPLRFTLHAGCNISVGGVKRYAGGVTSQRGASERFTISPSLIWRVQGEHQNFCVGSYVGLLGFGAGLFYKKNLDTEASYYSFCAQYSSELFTLGYSFDFGKMSNDMRSYSPNIHEVSLMFKIRQRQGNTYSRYKPYRAQNMPLMSD